MKILISGASGQLGSELVSLCTRLEHEVIPTHRQTMDFMQPDSVAAEALRVSADWVINCAAYTHVDKAETNIEEAFTVNRDSAGRLAEAVAEYGGRMMHISTDYVFDGQQSQPYREDDQTNPLNIYGKSKLEGEQAVLAALPEAAIVRTAWVYGIRGRNFVKTMLRVAGEGKPLRVVNDQQGSPSWTHDIAEAILMLVKQDASGTYHYCNDGSISWHEFASAIIEDASRIGFPVRTGKIDPIPIMEYPTPALRPHYSTLDTGKAGAILPSPIPHWRDSLFSMLKELYLCADYW